MKLQVYSDLHIEFEAFDAPKTDADVIILAGDIGVGIGGVEFAATLAKRAPVIYVAGNHEYYHHSIEPLRAQMRDLGARSGVHVLDDEAVAIDGVTFLGATLWSDFCLFGDEQAELCEATARIGMSDYRVIDIENGHRRALPSDTVAMSRTSHAWIAETCRFIDGPKVVITHHAPSARSVPDKHAKDHLSAAFASHYDQLVEDSGAALWIHGHTHHNVDYAIGSTRVVSNQRGYPGEDMQGFDLRGLFSVG